jgi:hypothetical protein
MEKILKIITQARLYLWCGDRDYAWCISELAQPRDIAAISHSQDLRRGCKELKGFRYTRPVIIELPLHAAKWQRRLSASWHCTLRIDRCLDPSRVSIGYPGSKYVKALLRGNDVVDRKFRW